MTDFQIQFYENWTRKLNEIEGDNLISVFDRFYTSYVIYNFLYNQVPEYQINLGIPVPRKLYDNKKATNFLVQSLGAGAMKIAVEQHHEEDIQTVIRLISDEEFYINLYYGDRQRNEDLKLLDELNSNSVNKRVTTILKIIYYVRCNLFHGHKDFVERQSELLVPLTKILTTVNGFVYNKLNEGNR